MVILEMVMGKYIFINYLYYRCNSLCEVEIGYECTRGSGTTCDVCYEICGDSWNKGNF